MNGKVAPKNAHVIAITSGKGGVGKTNMSTNLGILIAQSGKKVCVVDADHGLANINILLGLAPYNPEFDIYERPSDVSLAITHSQYGVDILPAFSGMSRESEVKSPDQLKITTLFQYLKTLYDVIIIDTAAGINRTVKNYLSMADYVILTLVPEPTSLTDGFGLVRAMQSANQNYQVVINRVSGLQQGKRIFERFSKAVKKFIGLNIEQLGYIEDDPYIPFAILRQKPIVYYRADSPSTHCMDRISQKIIRNLHVSQNKQKTSKSKPLPKNPTFNQVERPQKTPFDLWLDKLPEFFSGFSDNKEQRIERFNQFRDKLLAIIDKDAHFEKNFIKLAHTFRVNSTAEDVSLLKDPVNKNDVPTTNWFENISHDISIPKTDMKKPMNPLSQSQYQVKEDENVEVKRNNQESEDTEHVQNQPSENQSNTHASNTSNEPGSMNNLLSVLFSKNYGNSQQELKDTLNFLRKLS